MSPPVLGFNNNVRHRGRVFHIQTEDSGIKSPHIITHLFADGGHIIKSARTDYARHLGRPGLQELVRQMMKAQHKAMATALFAGEFDALIEAALGPFVQPARRVALDEPPPPQPQRPPVDSRVTRVETPSPVVAPVLAKSDPTRPRKVTPPNGNHERNAVVVHASSEALPPLREQSLDEVILSYLADDLDASLK